MADTFRALCAELIEIVEEHCNPDEYSLLDVVNVLNQAHALLAQPEPQGETDEELLETAAEAVGYEHVPSDEICLLLARAVLQRFRGRPAIKPVPLTPDAAFAIGQTGGPPSEAERLAFEAWMRGHSWLVAGKWNGTTYADPQERHSSVDVPAMQTRMLWAAWRDRAALGRPAIEPVSVSERLPEPGIKVLAHYFNSHGKSRTVCARWIPAKFESGDSDVYDDDFLEYDEESDTFYWPEAWYEEIENWDDYGSVKINEGEVTHWQPLPHWALPVPQNNA